MKTINIFQFLAILFLFSLAVSQVDAQQNYFVWWDSTYTGPGLAQDSAVAMVMDDAGNIYVTGWSVLSAINTDIVTIKYNKVTGDRIWTSSYNYNGLVDKPTAIAIDNASGSLYVTGYSYWSQQNPNQRDFVTIKYNAATGDTLWTRRYNGAGDGGDESWAIGIDNSGNIFVTGFGDQGVGTTTLDIVTIKYTPNGDPTIKVLLLQNAQQGNALKIDNSGNVFVAGYTRITGNNPENDDYITVKYNNSLDTLWTRTYNGTSNYRDNAIGLVTDLTGNAYVTGFSHWVGQLYNYVTIKYSPNGDSLNAASYNWTFNKEDVPSSIAIDDNSGSIYVTGSSVATLTPTVRNDFATVKYNSSLVQQWVQRLNGTADGDDRASSLAVKSDTIYVTGMSMGALTYDYLVVKYDNSGVMRTLIRKSSPDNLTDYPSSIAVDDSSNIFVTGAAVRYITGLGYYTVRFSLSPLPGVVPISNKVPARFELYQNYPNPFNPSTTIRFDLAKTSDVKIIIYDLTGRQVDLITEKDLIAGEYELKWDAVNLASGVYLYTIVAGDYLESKKMMLVK